MSSPADRSRSGPPPSDDDSPPTSAEARAALEDLDADASQLAGRLVTPRWYHLLVAAAVALAMCALIIPRVHPAAVVPTLVICSPSLIFAYTRDYGVARPHRAGRRSRRAMVWTVAVLAVLLGIAVLLKISALSSWLILLPAAASFVAVFVLGHRYDAAVRTEVADPGKIR